MKILHHLPTGSLTGQLLWTIAVLLLTLTFRHCQATAETSITTSAQQTTTFASTTKETQTTTNDNTTNTSTSVTTASSTTSAWNTPGLSTTTLTSSVTVTTISSNVTNSSTSANTESSTLTNMQNVTSPPTATTTSATSEQATTTTSFTQPVSSDSTTTNSTLTTNQQGNGSTLLTQTTEASSHPAVNSTYTTIGNNDTTDSNDLHSNMTTEWINTTKTTIDSGVTNLPTTLPTFDTSSTLTNSTEDVRLPTIEDTSSTVEVTATVSQNHTGSTSTSTNWSPPTTTLLYNATFVSALISENSRLQDKITDLDDKVESLTIAVGVIAALLGLFILIVIIIIAVKCLRSEQKSPIDDFERGPNSRTFFRPDSQYDVLDNKGRQSNNIRQSYIVADSEMIPLDGENLGTFNSRSENSSVKKSRRSDEHKNTHDNLGLTVDDTDSRRSSAREVRNSASGQFKNEAVGKSNTFVDVAMD